MTLNPRAGRTPAIAGLGMTDLGRVYGPSARQFAAIAVDRARRDAGIGRSDIDGLLISSGIGAQIGVGLAADLGLTDLRMLAEVNAYGASAASMVQYASLAVMSGLATTVACVFADAPLVPDRGAAGAYGGFSAAGLAGYAFSAGIDSAGSMYALAARRHMETYGTTKDQLGAVAISTRAWAQRNPLAAFRTPLTLDEYRAARPIADPFGLFDCCLVSNGGIAVIVTTAERAADTAQPPVHVFGWAQSHMAQPSTREGDFGIRTGAVEAGRRLFEMAGITAADVTCAEVYDCFTYTTLVTLEDYGFCDKGDGGAFVESGAIAPGGSLPVNTGGGELSAYYMWGMTPLSEAVMQVRGQADGRQVDDRSAVLVTGNGGLFEHHASLLLSSERALDPSSIG